MAEQNPFIDLSQDVLGKEIKAVPKPEKDIGIDTQGIFYQNIINAGRASAIDIGAINSFSQISNSRDMVYNLLDTMAEDSTVAAILETYAEDATEYNDEGRIVWVDSSDSDVAAYVDFLLKSLKIEKNIYKWAYSLCKYGDVYLRLYRKSDYYDILFDEVPREQTVEERGIYNRYALNEELEKEDARNSNPDSTKEKKDLNEDILIKAYAKNDRYVRYLEMVPNPAEVFELTKFGKTHAYIQAQINSMQNASTNMNNLGTSSFFGFRFKKNDIKIYQPTEFVHACLEDNSSRTPETVQIFIPKSELRDYTDDGRYPVRNRNPRDEDEEEDERYGREKERERERENNNSSDPSANGDDTDEVSASYTVKRGQSLLYDSYKIWRQLQLLENAILLSRLTRSSLVRIIQVEVGDMPKESVIPHMSNIKSLIEQKSAITAGSGMNEYTNPGAVENCVYIPTHEGVGAITMSNIGGDYNIRDIADLDYYQDKFFGSAKVPKQYFGVTKDGAGFDGGQSLSIISSRYAKMIKRIQNTLIQMITDAINLLLLNDGLENYINKFTIKMMPPTTQEEIDRRENYKNRISYVRDTMDLFADIDDTAMKLKLLKALLASAITDTEVIELLQEQIDALETEKAETEAEVNQGAPAPEGSSESSEESSEKPSFGDISPETPLDLGGESEPESAGPAGEPLSGDVLPSGAELGIDLTDFGDI